MGSPSLVRTVVVIGAGFGGLAAAKTLVEEGKGLWRVIVLEGGERVGGRARTAQIGGCGEVEFGATYLHGVAGNPLYTIAQDDGLLGDIQTTEVQWGFVQQRAPAPVPSSSAPVISRAVTAVSSGSNASCEAPQPGHTVGASIQEAYQQALEQTAAEQRPLLASAARWAELVLRANAACATSLNVSAAWWGEYTELGGPNAPIPGGFSRVAQSLAEGLDIRFRHLVTRVKWSRGGVAIECSNRTTFAADAAIVTVSLGVLKADHEALFNPPLPPSKVAAIQKLEFGVVEKLFVDFSGAAASGPLDVTPETPFDPKAGSAQLPAVVNHLLWDQPTVDAAPLQPHQEVKGEAASGLPAWARGCYSFRFGGSEFKGIPVPGGHSPAKPLRPDSYFSTPPKFTGSASRAFGNATAETTYLAQHHTPPGLPQEDAPSIPSAACLWVTGAQTADAVAASEEEVHSAVAALLAEFPAIRTPPLPPGASAELLPVYRSAWGADPLFRGSYSYASAASGPAHIDALGAPMTAADAAAVGESNDGVVENGQSKAVAMPVLLFAGEATHRTYTGCTHGAFISGQREARFLLSAAACSPQSSL